MTTSTPKISVRDILQRLRWQFLTLADNPPVSVPRDRHRDWTENANEAFAVAIDCWHSIWPLPDLGTSADDQPASLERADKLLRDLEQPLVRLEIIPSRANPAPPELRELLREMRALVQTLRALA